MSTIDRIDFRMKFWKDRKGRSMVEVPELLLSLNRLSRDLRDYSREMTAIEVVDHLIRVIEDGTR